MSGSIAKAGPGIPVVWRQGIILSFDQVTLENTVLVGGAEFTNIPVRAVSEAAILRAGSVVGIMCVGSSWAIDGRMVIPGTAEAAEATALLSSWTYTKSVDTQEVLATTSYTDLATAGPSVTVPVRSTGRLWIAISLQVGWDRTAASPPMGGAATIEMSGANTLAADDAAVVFSARDYIQVVGTVTQVIRVANPAATRGFDALNAGYTTITMKYRALAANNTDFSRRTLTVITL